MIEYFRHPNPPKSIFICSPPRSKKSQLLTVSSYYCNSSNNVQKQEVPQNIFELITCGFIQS